MSTHRPTKTNPTQITSLNLSQLDVADLEERLAMTDIEAEDGWGCGCDCGSLDSCGEFCTEIE